MEVQGKYLKDEQGKVISPITNVNTIYDGDIPFNQYMTNAMNDYRDGYWRNNTKRYSNLLYASSASTGYVYLGFFKIPNQGQIIVLNIHLEAGQNGGGNQNHNIRVTIVKGWVGEAADKQVGVTVETFSNYANEQIVVTYENRSTGFGVYVYLKITHSYSTIYYTADGTFDYEEIPTRFTLSTTPTNGSALQDTCTQYVNFVSSNNIFNYKEYSCLYTYGEPTPYNLASGFAAQKVNFASYYQNPNNKYIYDRGDGHSIGIKSSGKGLMVKISAVIQLDNTARTARELYGAIFINNTKVTENYMTSTKDVPQIYIYTQLPFYKCKGNEIIDLRIYSNNAGKVKVQCAPKFLKTCFIVEQIS